MVAITGATRHYRALEALARTAGGDAAHAVAVELGRLRSRIDAYRAAHLELSDTLTVEVEGIARRVAVLEARLAELDTRFTPAPSVERRSIPVERT